MVVNRIALKTHFHCAGSRTSKFLSQPAANTQGMAQYCSNVLENFEEGKTTFVLLSFGNSGIVIAKGGFTVIRSCNLLISGATLLFWQWMNDFRVVRTGENYRRLRRSDVINLIRRVQQSYYGIQQEYVGAFQGKPPSPTIFFPASNF